MTRFNYSKSKPASRTDPVGLRSGQVARFPPPSGYYGGGDGRAGSDRDTFLVDGKRLSADSFGNYIAGYGATYPWGPVGWGGTSFAGMLYDVEDVVQGRPCNWDADSRADIDAGAIRQCMKCWGGDLRAAAVEDRLMSWVLVTFYVVLSMLAYFAMVGRTPTRRLFSAIGIIAVQVAALVWVQIIARAMGSQSDRGAYSLGVGELYLTIRPILLFNVVVCIALVLIFLVALNGKKTERD